MRKLLFLLLSVAVFATSCKKDDDPYVAYSSGGYVKGSITTQATMSDGISTLTNESFSYSQYNNDASSYYTVSTSGSSTYRELHIERELTLTGLGNASIDITQENGITTGVTIDVSYSKKKNNTLLSFSESISGTGVANTSSSEDVVLTDFTFDATSGKVKGKYVATKRKYVSSSTYTPVATITGEFEATLNLIVRNSSKK